jgi:hypothetical protein
MRLRILIAVISLTVLLIPYKTVYGQNMTAYTIQIQDDGSAVCIIKQTGTNITVSLETLTEFQNKVASLIETAKNETGRAMAANVETMSIASFFNGSLVTIEYRFEWTNFSYIQDGKILVGDVFIVENFWARLYGYGTVYNLTYPPQYAIETVAPSPYIRDESHQALLWLGTTIFQAGEPRIVLKEKSSSVGFLDALMQNAIPLVGLAVLVSGFSVGFYMFRRRRKEGIFVESPKFPNPGIESDEEKTLRLLKSHDGSLHQSAIKEQLRFSRAKTSQLLTALEAKGMVKRYKKGRDKIVVLIELDKK